MWAKIASVVFPWLLKHAMTMGAKVFRDKYKPDVHARKSRRFMWDNHWAKFRNYVWRTENKFDDAAGDFVYWYNAGWIEDNTLRDYLSTIQTAIEHDNPVTAMNAVNEIRKLAYGEPEKEKS